VSFLFYVSHPNVVVDPSVSVPEWGLSELGRHRAEAMLEQPWMSTVDVIVSSPEMKAMETAEVLATHLSQPVDVLIDSTEVDRSATGFVPHERHEALADRLFAAPRESAGGWERAADAQERIWNAFAPPMAQVRSGLTVAAVGHGGVGTLLLCRLLGVEIDRSLDQAGQGHYWAWDGATEEVVHQWRPIDEIAGPG